MKAAVIDSPEKGPRFADFDEPAVPDAAFTAVQQHYTDRQIVEAIALAGYYFLIARLTPVLDVPLDPRADDAVLRAGRAVHSDRW